MKTYYFSKRRVTKVQFPYAFYPPAGLRLQGGKTPGSDTGSLVLPPTRHGYFKLFVIFLSRVVQGCGSLENRSSLFQNHINHICT